MSPAQAPPPVLLCLNVDNHDLVFIHDPGTVASHGDGCWPNLRLLPTPRGDLAGPHQPV